MVKKILSKFNYKITFERLKMTFPFSLIPFGCLIKLHYSENKADIDSFVAKLHHKFTTSICFLLSILAYEFFGEEITCTFIPKEYSQDYVDSFCWASTEFKKPGNLYLPYPL